MYCKLKVAMQAVLTEVRDDYRINSIFLINEILSKHDETSIAV